MNITSLDIPEVLLIEPQIFEDERGFFFESFNEKKFTEAVGRNIRFVQDNHSKSLKSVLRGLHYQLAPMAQGKLVQCIQGEIYDVAVDLRTSSPTFGQWVGNILSAANRHQLWVPEGFAHGFVTRSETAELFYKTTNFYAPEYERCIIWNDPTLNVPWACEEPILSRKDTQGILFDLADCF